MENDRALRYNSKKIRFELIAPEALLELAKVYTAGAEKYAADNWRKGMPYRECLGSLQRHLKKWEMGLKEDPETNCHHLAHVAWNALTLYVYELHGLGTDDRVKLPKQLDEDFNWSE